MRWSLYCFECFFFLTSWCSELSTFPEALCSCFDQQASHCPCISCWTHSLFLTHACKSSCCSLHSTFIACVLQSPYLCPLFLLSWVIGFKKTEFLSIVPDRDYSRVLETKLAWWLYHRYYGGCGALNVSGPHKLLYLDTRSPIRGTVFEGLGSMVLLREVCHWKWVWSFKSPCQAPCNLWIRCELSAFAPAWWLTDCYHAPH